MRRRVSIYSSGSHSLLGSSPISERSSVNSNKYTDTPRERRQNLLNLKESSSLCMENSLISGKKPKTWFNVGPISGDSNSKHDALNDSAKLSRNKDQSPEICNSKIEICPAVQLIKLTFKDRPPGSSKRVSAGSQDRQTATRDESSRRAEQKDLMKLQEVYNKTLNASILRDNPVCFSFLTHSESAMEKSSTSLQPKSDQKTYSRPYIDPN